MDIKTKAKKIITDLIETNSDKNFKFSPLETKQYNYEITIADGTAKLKLLVYFGKKGIRKVLQGKNDTSLYQEINFLINDEKAEFNFGDSKIDEPKNYIGTDESGKGDIFGPLVTAAVYLNQKSVAVLNEYGIRDSKTIKDAQIRELAKIIKDTVGDAFEIISINPEKYNQLYAKFNNLNELLAWSHVKAIENLSARCGCKEVIVDQFSKNVNTINGKLFSSKIVVQQTPKAERFTAVAAASILARDKFNSWFNLKLSKELYLKKGASLEVQEIGRNIKKRHGMEILNKVAKLHFKTFRQ